MDKNRNDLKDMIGKMLNDEGFELVDFLMKGSKSSRSFSVFVDHENGVSVGDCAYLSRKLLDMLDTEPEKWGLDAYKLIVSSPGIDRPLREKKDYLRNVGRDVGITYLSNGKIEKAEGTILGADEISVSLRVKEQTVSLELSSIREARLTVKWK